MCLQLHCALLQTSRRTQRSGAICAFPSAALALPWLKHLRPVLGIYMNPDGVDLSQISNLVPTVDDPVRKINAELARWVQSRELRVGGISVAEGLRSVTDVPILALCANRDGIVPPAVARSVEAYVPADQLTVRVIGDDDRWYAHADLFIGHHAREDVFAPLADWLSSPRSAPA